MLGPGPSPWPGLGDVRPLTNNDPARIHPEPSSTEGSLFIVLVEFTGALSPSPASCTHSIARMIRQITKRVAQKVRAIKYPFTRIL